jgi:lipid-A-disaccharide synthase-like uncharacterized protein
MLRWGLSIFGAALILLAILSRSGGIGSCGPSSGMLPVFLAYILAFGVGALLTLIGSIRLTINWFRHRKERGVMPRITPL